MYANMLKGVFSAWVTGTIEFNLSGKVIVPITAVHILKTLKLPNHLLCTENIFIIFAYTMCYLHLFAYIITNLHKS